MPQLLKQIESNVDSGILSNTFLIKEVIGYVQQEDYVNVSSFVAYLQDFSKCDFTSGLSIPSPFGLNNSFGKPIQILNISY